jgi:hypothetical protein
MPALRDQECAVTQKADIFMGAMSGVLESGAPADLEVGDTADSEVCATLGNTPVRRL